METRVYKHMRGPKKNFFLGGGVVRMVFEFAEGVFSIPPPPRSSIIQTQISRT